MLGDGVHASDFLGVYQLLNTTPSLGWWPYLGVMARDAKKMRGEGPTIFAQVTKDVGVAEIAERVVAAARGGR